MSDKDAYNAAVQTLKDVDKIRNEGTRTKKGFSEYNENYNYACFKREPYSTTQNVVGDAVGYLSSGAHVMGISSVPSSDGNNLCVFDTGFSAEYAAVLDPILDRMPNGSDKEKAEYMVQQICDRFSYI